MSDIFYYVGIIYIINYLKVIYDLFASLGKFNTETIKEIEKVETLAQNMDMVGLKKDLKKNILSTILGAVTSFTCYWWLIYGYLYSPEKHIFLILIIVSLSFVLTIFYKVIKLMKDKQVFQSIRQGDFFGGLKNALSDEDLPQTIFLIMNRLIKIGLAGYIIYLHFYTN